jgi:hypothetical protein
MSEGILNRNCESCDVHISVLDLCQEPDLILCELCKPWVLDSIYQVPHSVLGFEIINPEMFTIALKLMEGFSEPENEHDWLDLLSHIYSPGSIYQDYSQTTESKLIDFIRKDFGNRWKIYDEDARNMHHPIAAEDRINANIWTDDFTLHFDFMLDMQGIMTHYLDKRKEIEEQQIKLRNSGWGDYAKNLTWSNVKPKVHILDYANFSFTTDDMTKVLDWADEHSISYDFVLQLFFDWASTEAGRELDSLLSETEIYAPTIFGLSFKYKPISPEFCRKIYHLIFGYNGNNLQYLMLAAIQRLAKDIKPSHNFLVRKEDIWTRSFQLLRGIIESLGRSRAIIDYGLIKIKGDSGRWYGLKPAVFKTYRQWWQVSILPKGPLICIDIQKQHIKMPIGDQLASVVLTLANDSMMDSEVYTLADHIFED